MIDIMTSIDYSLISDHAVFGASWDPTNFFKNAQNIGKTIGGAFLGLLGIIALIYGGAYLYQVATSNQQKGGLVVKAIIAFIIGGMLVVGGFKLIEDIATGGYNQVEKLG
ncbi:hypothetical protein [Staphylococcus hyicus]|uniref:hypothetical protein n=1 Tax=Staphylococcus hyicus TaxID=1284 RepID=UPI0031330606